jgi:hypothetical protein
MKRHSKRRLLQLRREYRDIDSCAFGGQAA